MSISLNDHENRIKVLESKKPLCESIWSGTMLSGSVTLSKSVNMFDMLLVKVGLRYPYGDVMEVPVSRFNFDQEVKLEDDTNHDIVFKVSDTTMSIRLNFVDSETRANSRILSVIGLKLYYSFSYNIIYRAKHLLEKIFMS